MINKLRVGILFGGRSAEHEVSLQSAKSIIDSLDRSKYDVVLIGIDKTGKWYLNDASKFLLNVEDPSLIKLNTASAKEVALVPGEAVNQLVPMSGSEQLGHLDVVFPVLHGPFGEDGTVQGLLKLANIPFVGVSVLGSAVGMDKDVTKRLLREAGIPTPKFMTFDRMKPADVPFEHVKKGLGLPVFIKPANLGSSVGIHKAHDAKEFNAGVKDALSFDTKIIIEEAIEGRELECAVLGNENPEASLPGEVKPSHEFYDYEAKYIDEHGAALDIPAKVNEDVVHRVKELAVRTFMTLGCEGMARVDFFLKKDGGLMVNEINTIPGFTKISMYPKLWQASSVPFDELLDRLIRLAIERFEREKGLRTSYT